jgi:NitT/TauT family transport system permease protein
MPRPLTPDNQTLGRLHWTWQDNLLILAILTLIFWIVRTAAQFGGAYDAQLQIETTLSVLPSYTAQTLLRMGLAYGISLVFSLIYAYVAYHSALMARILIPLLDILQSIPVLSFLPGVVLALIALFPGQRIGIELAAILLIFTGMAWNLTFSFYQSLTSLPRELREAARIYRLSCWQQFWTMELPAGAIGLVWNSVMSVAGGWFFLIAIESFTLGNQSFRLPGLGSYLKTAADQGNFYALAWGLGVLIGVIIVIDFLIWRPLIAWAEKFKFQMVEAEAVPESVVLDYLRRSPTLRIFNQRIWQPLQDRIDQRFAAPAPRRHPVALPPDPQTTRTTQRSINRLLNGVFMSGFAAIVLWGTWEAVIMVQLLSWQDWRMVLTGAVLTALRVMVALLLSLLWAVPVGVAIGQNPRVAQVLQPIVQIAASVPATALFPFLLLTLANIGGGLEIGAVALMMLGTMWYLLFNVIAGAQAIPADLFEASRVYRLSWIQRWRTLILPGIFPYLITGIITAVGGAWNASIVSEYVQFQGQTQSTLGLGSTISTATAEGNFALLLASTAVMSLLVVLTNRLVWRPLYQLAQAQYQLL